MKLIVKILLLVSVYTQGSFGAEARIVPNIYKLNGEGSTRFLAVGRPSAIKIRGEGAGPMGELRQKSNSSTMDGIVQMDLNSIKTGIDLRDRHMKEKYLKTNENPSARLELHDLQIPKKSEKLILFSGELEINGVKKLIKGTYDIVDFKETSGLIRANFTINISDFEIDVPKYAGISVANAVDVEIESLFEILK